MRLGASLRAGRQGKRGFSRLRSSAQAAWSRHRLLLIVLGLSAAIRAFGASDARLSPGAGARHTGERHPKPAWVACNRNARNGKPSTFRPLSDAEAAALVTPQPEIR